ncbi:hypothetical protein CYY_000807 [Polysphondylium violaceum]|uniref:Uncharacterized protein n=1 Tax=Polysphondylium violaceum TaxID=133409 RepID=A0A8J4Q341_9MYCE|nr:hypothetical protein CYY_000807 [Polysphondylium violaceum]
MKDTSTVESINSNNENKLKKPKRKQKKVKSKQPINNVDIKEPQEPQEQEEPEQEQQEERQVKKEQQKEKEQIFTKGKQITSLIDSWLNTSSSIDVYQEDTESKEATSTSNTLDKYTMKKKSLTNDTNQDIFLKSSSSPFYMLENKNSNNNSSNSNSNNNKKDVVGMTKNQLDNVLIQSNKKKNYTTSQNLNRYQPYANHRKGEEIESKSQSISKSANSSSNGYSSGNKRPVW